MRPLIIGEAPGRGTGRPIEGRIGRRLADLAGLSFEEFRRSFARENVLDYWPGTDGKGAVFPRDEAKAVAERLASRIRRQRRTVVLLGRRVSFAFGLGGAAYFQRIVFGYARVVVLPHPTGINRWYNSPANREQVRRFFREDVFDGKDKR
jgi:uracil-DNA glycosylase